MPRSTVSRDRLHRENGSSIERKRQTKEFQVKQERQSRSPCNSSRESDRRENRERESRRDRNEGRLRGPDDFHRPKRAHSPANRNTNDRRIKLESEMTWGKRNDDAEDFGREDRKHQAKEPKEKEKPSFELSGNLAADTNTYKGVVIKYNEPPEARKPRLRWRLYPFKGDEQLPLYQIHRQSAYLLGRDRHIADIPIDHPSASKQHAVLQYRVVSYTRDDGSKSKCVRPYVIDLGSSNGTYLNNQKIESQRYVELREKDVLKFGFSTREYVLMHENMKDEEGSEDDGQHSDTNDTERPIKREEQD